MNDARALGKHGLAALLWMAMVLSGSLGCDRRTPCSQVSCTLGQRICSARAVLVCGQAPASGCYYWGTLPCGPGESCQMIDGRGQCSQATVPPPGCKNPQYRKGCVGNDVHWFDDCGQQQAKVESCPGGQICLNGACQSSQCPSPCTPGTTRCSGLLIEVCQTSPQPGGCPIWNRYSTCSAPYTCKEGRCVKDGGGCTDACQPGQLKCEGNGVSACQRGADGCLGWSPPQACAEGQSCQGGQCTSTAPHSHACCVGQSCQELSSSACQAQSGQLHQGQTCAQVNCAPAPSLHACCQASSCSMKSLVDCQSLQGTAHQGKTCNDKPCGSSNSGSCGSKGSGGSLQSRTGWPCTGCYFAVPSGYAHSTPTPLVVALHGDEGRADYIYQVFKPSVTKEGWLLASLSCPRDKGCNGSWWRWRDQSGRHDASWVNAMVDQIEKSYNIDRKRIYLTGWSGGSSYNSSHATTHADRYAAVNYNSGGHSFNPCPTSCKIPAYYYIGSGDFLLSSAQKGKAKFESCGHKVVWDLLSGVDHQGISRRLSNGGAAKIVQWFKQNPHQCLKCTP